MARSASELVEELRGAIGDKRVLRAVAEVPRYHFVPRDLREYAWENRALPIGACQTISQPAVVARMCELLELSGDETVLDVGTGSGYHAAVLSRLAGHVYSIEQHAELTQRAQQALQVSGVANVTLLTGDGTRGHADHAPYNAINVAACADEIPVALEQQLAPGGRLIIPLDGKEQRLVLLRRAGMTSRREQHELVRFVPLINPHPDRSHDNDPAAGA